MSKTLNLALSIFSLFFIAGLVSVLYFKVEMANPFLRGVIELVTIPTILMTIALFIFNVNKWSREKWSMKKSTFYAVIILGLSMITMITATIFNI